MKKRISFTIAALFAVSSALCGCNMVLQKNEKIQESSTDLKDRIRLKRRYKV